VTRERVAAYVAELQVERAPYTVLDRVQGLDEALRVMAPDSDWKWLAQLRWSLKAQVHPVRDKLSRLRQPEELIALGERLRTKPKRLRAGQPNDAPSSTATACLSAC
jgi:hypothetical protein